MTDRDDLPPGDDISVAPNYKAGGVWFSAPGRRRVLLSPEKAREIADEMDAKFGDQYDEMAEQGYEVGLSDKLRELSDKVEAADE